MTETKWLTATSRFSEATNMLNEEKDQEENIQVTISMQYIMYINHKIKATAWCQKSTCESTTMATNYIVLPKIEDCEDAHGYRSASAPPIAAVKPFITKLNLKKWSLPSQTGRKIINLSRLHLFCVIYFVNYTYTHSKGFLSMLAIVNT